MPFTPASAGSVACFDAILLAVLALILAAVRRAYRGDPAAGRVTFLTTIALTLWLGTLGAVVASGRLSSLPLAGLPFFFSSILIVSVAAGFSKLGGRIATHVPLAALVGFQAFRLPLELVLHSWAAQDTIPETMTWTGRNWDIVSGIVALLAAPFAARRPVLAWVANIIGGVLLLNVMTVALRSAPGPLGWNLDRPLLVAFHLPYALIGPVCVGGALAGHIVLTRALLRRPAVFSHRMESPA